MEMKNVENYNFIIKVLRLQNFRRFHEKQFEFSPQMNVFIGKNASGKTSVLEAMTIIAGAYLSSFKQYVPSRFVQNISDQDVFLKGQIENNFLGRTVIRKNKGVLNFIGPAETVQQFPCQVEAEILWNHKLCSCKRALEKAGGRTKFIGENPFRNLVQDWEQVVALNDGSDEKYIFPLVLYLSSARLWNENKGKEMTALPQRFDAYHRCLDSKRSSQMAFEYLRLLQMIAVEDNQGKSYDEYNEILGALQKAIADELKPGQRLKFSSRFGEIVLENPDGAMLRFNNLSDGYRNVIKIVADIAARMCILNPYLGKETLQKTPGIVMIDELDLSLHPTWQKRIVRILKELFPKVQFFCATHSPFIIQSLEPGELIALDQEIDSPYSGRSIEDIAEDIMQVSTPQYSEKKQEMFQATQDFLVALKTAASSEDLKKLRERMDLLQAQYSDNPAYYALLKMKLLEKEAILHATGEQGDKS